MEFLKIIQELKKEFEATYQKMDVANKKHNDVLEKYRHEVPRLTQEAASEEHMKIVNDWNAEKKSIIDELNQKVNESRVKYEAAINELLMPQGANINDDDVKLLNSGILLTILEVNALIEKNAENATMLRIIDRYVSDNRMLLDSQHSIALSRAKKQGEKLKSAFNAYCQMCNNAVRMFDQGFSGTNSYIKSCDSIEEYTLMAERDILSAKLFVDDESKNRIDEINEIFAQANNDRSLTKSSDIV